MFVVLALALLSRILSIRRDTLRLSHAFELGHAPSMTTSQLAQLSAFRLSKTGLPPLKVQIELSFPQGGLPPESHGESRYSDIAISHLISMLKKLMFSFGSEGFRSALEAIEQLGSLKDIAKAGPRQVARPGGCEFLDHRRTRHGDDVAGAKQPGALANDCKRLAFARRRSESSQAPLRGSTAAEVELGPSTQSLPLGLFAKDVWHSSSRNRAASMHGGTANRPSVDASLSRSSTRCDGSGPEADADNFVNDLPLTLAPAARSSTGPTSVALLPTAEPRARQRKDKVDEEEETYTLPSIAELPEMEGATPCSDRTIATLQFDDFETS
ncbi:hypothetical protein AK812_SmicGene37046 [Symbiodinium microadriaticum]|uniref:Uncharacterized protein n=1 Tax=Symbiodinium microadriaticum TaxID=2951 RepID=A0A1Q9CHA7_SYMMI|nr:hypothetical protein AK812_SmicGene37046 [Symbiodinium microadriaticum]